MFLVPAPNIRSKHEVMGLFMDAAVFEKDNDGTLVAMTGRACWFSTSPCCDSFKQAVI
jgi:hypothetical protein